MRNRASLRLLDRYHERLANLAERAATRVARQLAADNLQSFPEENAPLFEAAQSAAVSLATAFYTAYRLHETGKEHEPTEPVPVGLTLNEASLEASLVGPRVKVYEALKDKDMAEALRFGRFATRRLVQTEVLDASQREIRNQMLNDPLSSGWRWKARGTCGACAAMDNGSHLPAGTPLHRHPYCVCVAEPGFKGVREGFRRPTGAETFAALPLSTLIDRMGVEKAERFKKGEIALEDLASTEHKPGFSPFVVEATLEQATS